MAGPPDNETAENQIAALFASSPLFGRSSHAITPSDQSRHRSYSNLRDAAADDPGAGSGSDEGYTRSAASTAGKIHVKKPQNGNGKAPTFKARPCSLDHSKAGIAAQNDQGCGATCRGTHKGTGEGTFKFGSRGRQKRHLKTCQGTSDRRPSGREHGDARDCATFNQGCLVTNGGSNPLKDHGLRQATEMKQARRHSMGCQDTSGGDYICCEHTGAECRTTVESQRTSSAAKR